MAKQQYLRAGLCTGLCLLLSACAAPMLTTRNVEDFLRAPQPDSKQSAVQKALNAYLGETLQLKYPRGGEEMTPFLIQDFDGDGVDEAAVLYATPAKGQNVHLAILEQENAAWEVVYEVEGLSTEVERVETVDTKSGGVDLLVGYANASMSDKYLAAYAYQNDTITSLLEQAYSRFLVNQFDEAGTESLLLISPGAPVLQHIVREENALTTVQALPLDERFVECVNLAVGESKNGAGVVIDGRLDSGALASEFLLVQNGRLIAWPMVDKQIDSNAFDLSRRFQTELLSMDVDGDGSIEVPHIDRQINTLSTARRFYFVSWHDYLLDEPLKREGIYDALYGYYVRLPKGWTEKVSVLDDATPNGNWQLRSRDGGTLFLSARIVPREAANGPYVHAAALGENRLLLYFGEGSTGYDKKSVLSGITVLE